MKGEKRKLSLQMPNSRKPRKEIKGCSLLNHPKSEEKSKVNYKQFKYNKSFYLVDCGCFSNKFLLHKKTFYFNRFVVEMRPCLENRNESRDSLAVYYLSLLRE